MSGCAPVSASKVNQTASGTTLTSAPILFSAPRITSTNAVSGTEPTRRSYSWLTPEGMR